MNSSLILAICLLFASGHVQCQLKEILTGIANKADGSVDGSSKGLFDSFGTSSNGQLGSNILSGMEKLAKGIMSGGGAQSAQQALQFSEQIRQKYGGGTNAGIGGGVQPNVVNGGEYGQIGGGMPNYVRK